MYLLDAAREASDAEVLTSFLEQYYACDVDSAEIYVPAAVTDGEDLQTFLVEKRRAGPPAHAATRREA